MIKFLIAFKGAPGRSRAQSLDHYRERHGPLVSSIPEFWRHVRGYVQNFALDVPDGAPAAAAFDGASELWFENWDIHDRAFAEPLYLETIRPDEHRFADFSALLAVFAEEVALFSGSKTPPNKLLRFITRSADLSSDAFRAQWESHHASAMAADPIVRQFASGYVQNRPLKRDDLFFKPAEIIDGVDEFWFDSAEDLREFVGAMRGKEAGTSEGIIGSVIQIPTETHVVREPPVL